MNKISLDIYKMLMGVVFFSVLPVAMQAEEKIGEWEEGNHDPYAQAINNLDIDGVYLLFKNHIPVTVFAVNAYINKQINIKWNRRNTVDCCDCDEIQIKIVDSKSNKLSAIGDLFKTLYLKRGGKRPVGTYESNWEYFRKSVWPDEDLEKIIEELPEHKNLVVGCIEKSIPNTYQEYQKAKQEEQNKRLDELANRVCVTIKENEERKNSDYSKLDESRLNANDETNDFDKLLGCDELAKGLSILKKENKLDLFIKNFQNTVNFFDLP